MKKIILYFLIFVSINLFATFDDFYDTSIQNFIETLEEVISSEQTIVLGKFEGDKNNKVRSIIEKEIIASNKFSLIATEDLEVLQKEAIKQNDASFENHLEIGKFQNSNLLVNGSVIYNYEKSFFETNESLTIEIKAMNIEEGIILFKNNYSTNHFKSYFIYLVIVINLLLFLLAYFINHMSKGYYHKIIFYLMLLFTILIWIIYFFRRIL